MKLELASFVFFKGTQDVQKCFIYLSIHVHLNFYFIVYLATFALSVYVLHLVFVSLRDEMYYKAVHGTAIIFLQNNAGFAKWEPTTERIQELQAAYKISGRSLPSPGPSSAGTGDKDSKPVQERSTTSQDNSSPVDKTAPDTTNI